MKTVEYNNTTFEVDEETLEIRLNGKTITPCFNKQLNRWYLSYFDKDNMSRFVPRARLICLAFHPNTNYKKLQADHIDCDTTNDSPDNLRWLTRKQNNSTKHSIKQRSINHVNTVHSGEVIKATNLQTNEVRYFANGKHCAESIGCSAPLVYMNLNQNHYAKSAKGWVLEWTTDIGKKEVNAMKKQRREDNEKRLKQKEELKKKKEKMKLVNMLNKTNSKIQLWKMHLEKFELKHKFDCSNMQQKIAELEKQAKDLQKKIDAFDC